MNAHIISFDNLGQSRMMQPCWNSKRRGKVGPTGHARIWWRGNGWLWPASASAETNLILVKFNWNKRKRTGIVSPYFHNSYICIKIMLITSPKKTPLIKSSNMSTWKIRLHHMASYYKLQKENKVFSLVVLDGCMSMFCIWRRSFLGWIVHHIVYARGLLWRLGLT